MGFIDIFGDQNGKDIENTNETEMDLTEEETAILKEFEKDCGLVVDSSASLPTEKYNRFMIIGHKK